MSKKGPYISLYLSEWNIIFHYLNLFFWHILYNCVICVLNNAECKTCILIISRVKDIIFIYIVNNYEINISVYICLISTTQ